MGNRTYVLPLVHMSFYDYKLLIPLQTVWGVYAEKIYSAGRNLVTLKISHQNLISSLKIPRKMNLNLELLHWSELTKFFMVSRSYCMRGVYGYKKLVACRSQRIDDVFRNYAFGCCNCCSELWPGGSAHAAVCTFSDNKISKSYLILICVWMHSYAWDHEHGMLCSWALIA